MEQYMPKQVSKYKNVRFFGIKGKENSYSTKLRAQDAELVALNAVENGLFFINTYDNPDGTKTATLVPAGIAKPRAESNDL